MVTTECVWGDEKVSKCLRDEAATECNLDEFNKARFSSISIYDYATLEKTPKPADEMAGTIYAPLPQVPDADEAYFGPGDPRKGECNVKLFKGTRHVRILYFRKWIHDTSSCKFVATEIAKDFAKQHFRK
ncbi:hypothetical protein [Nocardia brasiliensis]|uniref:hypothetical protein n=1 Tax=Nocardia brasiliensis TaxID=37326 RepID=UPI0011DD199C|nr:hypothetical protein [Nocardia brasiliensis]